MEPLQFFVLEKWGTQLRVSYNVTSKAVLVSSGKFSERSSDSDVCLVDCSGDVGAATGSVPITSVAVVGVVSVGVVCGSGGIAAVTSADIADFGQSHTSTVNIVAERVTNTFERVFKDIGI